MNAETKHGGAVDVLAVVETYQCLMENGAIESGWTVKIGDDSLADFADETSAVLYADAYNVGSAP